MCILSDGSRQGLHPDGHCNRPIGEEPGAEEAPAAGWWRQSPERRRAEVIVRNAAGDEAEARQRRSYSDIRPRDNYPFRRIECRELPGAVPQIDEKFNSRKHVFVHVATK